MHVLLEVITCGLTLLTQLQRCQVLSTDLRLLPMVNVKPGVIYLKIANSEKKKGYNYAKVSIVTTILNVNYTKPKFPPFLKIQPR